MSKDNPFGFDPEKLSEMMAQADLSKYFNVKGFDGEALIEAQKKNMEALVDANRAAGERYQEIFKTQLADFQANMAKAQSQISEMKMPEAGDVEAQAELVRKSVEDTAVQMKELAEKAKSANEEAYQIVASRVQDAMQELQAMTEKLKG